MSIQFIFEEKSLAFLDQEKLKKVIEYIIKENKKVLGEILYTFVSDEEILEMNRNFLKHNYYTDIITFDNSFVNIINGEIFISFDTVKANSLKYNTNFEEEIYRVIIHGVIHLCGFGDRAKEEKTVMRNLENNYLAYLEKL